MRILSTACFVVALVAMVCFVGCTAQQVATSANSVAEAATAAAPLLPPPFGVIAGVIASLATTIGTLAASKVKGGAIAAGIDPHPIADFLSSNSWIWPSVVAAVGVANTKGWLHVSPTELATLAAGLGVTTAAQVVGDSHAEAQAPSIAPTPAPAPAPAPTAPASTT